MWEITIYIWCRRYIRKEEKTKKKNIVKAPSISSHSSDSSESENDSDYPKYLSDTENSKSLYY